MILPPKPKVVEAVADYLFRQDDCKRASSDLTRDVDAWGRACAEAALERAIKECKEHMLGIRRMAFNDWPNALDALDDLKDEIRNIKIEE